MRTQLRTPESLAIFGTRTTDAVALLTLLSTGEVGQQWALIIAALAIFAYLMRHRRLVSRNFLLFLMGAVIVGSIALWPRFRLHPLIVAGHAGPLVHSLLWISPRTYAQFQSRLAFGFLEISLASALSPELSVAAGIFTFFVAAAVQLMGLHLWDIFHQNSPQELKRPIPRRSIVLTIGCSLVVFIASLLLFPLLPRVRSPFDRGGLGRKGGLTELGYTESVELGSSLSWAKNATTQGEPVLRVYLEGVPAEESSFLFPLGLFKMRVLSRWDGKSWQPSKRHQTSLRPTSPSNSLSLRVIREPLPTDSLPFPYPGRWARLETASTVHNQWPQEEGLIRPNGVAGKRVAYDLILDSDRVTASSALPGPQPEDLWVPEGAGSLVGDLPRWRNLSKRVLGSAASLREKLNSLSSYYRDTGFLAELTDLPATYRNRPLLDRFLFEVRKGHCEWYSSASLLLLRMTGIPSRLVSGFKATAPPFGGVLTLRERDAHLWLEAWDVKTQRWVAYDPTPATPMSSGIWNTALEFFRETRSWASSQWYRWLLKPAETPDEWAAQRWSFLAAGSLTWSSLKNPAQGLHHLSQTLGRGWTSVRKFLQQHQGLFIVTLLGVAWLLSFAALKLLRAIQGGHWSKRSLRLWWRRARFAIHRRQEIDAPFEAILLRIRFSRMRAGSREFESALQELDMLLQGLKPSPRDLN